jgi:5-methylcytosine-specific restriction endonuclease McrA
MTATLDTVRPSCLILATKSNGGLGMGCLALNASYEPLTIIPTRRAVRMVIDQKAVALEVDTTRPMRSECLRMDTPIVIRLVRFIQIPRRFRRQVTNTFLFARDGYECQYCGRHRRQLGYRESLTRDHVIPISRGGGDGWANVVTACSKCNLRKADHLPNEYGFTLLNEPKEPNHVELIWTVRRVTPVQAQYIGMFYGRDVVDALSL